MLNLQTAPAWNERGEECLNPVFTQTAPHHSHQRTYFYNPVQIVVSVKWRNTFQEAGQQLTPLLAFSDMFGLKLLSFNTQIWRSGVRKREGVRYSVFISLSVNSHWKEWLHMAADVELNTSVASENNNSPKTSLELNEFLHEGWRNLFHLSRIDPFQYGTGELIKCPAIKHLHVGI